MSHSNSSLNCFTNCMRKYYHMYVKHTVPDCPPSPHLVFGTMAHEVLYKAGMLRDEHADNLQVDYRPVIPSEVLYPELKTEFQINNWYNYFSSVIKQIFDYEKELCDSMEEPYQIKREIKLQMSPEQIRKAFGYTKIEIPFVGIIDLLILGEKSAIIMDYKFSTTRKTQDDFDQNSQLYMYAMFISNLYNIPLRNIKVGYIDIPKKSFDQPTVLSNGTLSRSKSQNVSADLYKKAVEAIHGDDSVYNCEPGGHYYDCWCALQLNKAAYMSVQYLDEEAYEYIVNDLIDTAGIIESLIQEDKKGTNQNYFIRKYDSYSCKSCEYLKSCKPWLTVQKE